MACRSKDGLAAFFCPPPFVPSFCTPTSNCNGSGQSRWLRARLLWSFPAQHGTWPAKLEQTCIGGGHQRDFIKIRGYSGGRTWGLVPFQTEESFVLLGGCGRALRCVCARVCVCACAHLALLPGSPGDEKAGRGRRGRWRRGGQKAHLVSAAFMCKAGTQGSALAPSWNRSCRRSQTFQGCCTLEGWLLVPNAAGASALN